jgi:hypothetical protein
MRLRNLAVFVDHVRDAARVFIRWRFRGAVGESDFSIGVAEEWKVEVEFLGERGVVSFAVEADPENRRVLLVVLFREVPEPGTFFRSTGCVGLWIEPEDDFAAAQVAEADGVAMVIFDFEVGSGIAGLEHFCFSSRENLNDSAEAHALILSRGKQKAEGRRQKAEGRRQKAEGRRQKSRFELRISEF